MTYRIDFRIWGSAYNGMRTHIVTANTAMDAQRKVKRAYSKETVKILEWKECRK